MDRKGGPSRKQGAVGRLLDFAGPRKALTYLGCALSAASMIVGFGPYVCIWLVARDLIAVAPDWSAATSIAAYGWWALGFSVASILLYFAGLMCTHLAAFRCASNMRKRATEHLMRTSLGYFDTHASGALRRVVDGCAAETEGLLAHKLPDTAGSVAHDRRHARAVLRVRLEARARVPRARRPFALLHVLHDGRARAWTS